MACEYREADRSKLEATSSYAGATADEIYIIDRAGEYNGPCFEHLIEIYMASASNTARRLQSWLTYQSSYMRRRRSRK